MRKVYGKVALLLVLILVLSIGMTAMLGVQTLPDESTVSVVASIFPVYTAALQVVGSCEDVTVTCLTSPKAGCVHDYQLSPSEKAVLSSADVLIMNGAGAESFLETVLNGLPLVEKIDLSADIPLLSYEHGEDHHVHDHGENEHLWVDPVRYAQQVRRLRDGLCEADPAHATTYTQNAARYLEKIQQKQQELAEVTLPFTHAVLFHDSMAYVGELLGLKTIGTLPLGENRTASAAELSDIAAALGGKKALFLYDSQYDVLHSKLTEYADRAEMIRWNTAVLPIKEVAVQDTWIHAMQQNIKAVKEASA